MDSSSQNATVAQALLAQLQAMPPVAALQLAIEHDAGDGLTLSAPLTANVNDKGCAFGGSLVSLMTLAGWGLVTKRIGEAGLEADVFVADSEVRYLAPLYADLRAQASASEGASWEDFIHTLRTRGKARIGIDAQVPLPEGGIATSCRSRYVAVAKAPTG